MIGKLLASLGRSIGSKQSAGAPMAATARGSAKDRALKENFGAILAQSNLPARRQQLGTTPVSWGQATQNRQRADEADDAFEANQRAQAEARKGMLLLASGAVGAAGALAVFPKIISSLNNAQIEQQRRLGEFGGTIATAMARLDVERMQRDIRMASLTGRSTQQITQAQSAYEEAVQPWNAMATNLYNKIVGGLTDGVAAFIEDFNESAVGQAVISIAEWTGLYDPDAVPDQTAWVELLKELKEPRKERRF